MVSLQLLLWLSKMRGRVGVHSLFCMFFNADPGYPHFEEEGQQALGSQQQWEAQAPGGGGAFVSLLTVP